MMSMPYVLARVPYFVHRGFTACTVACVSGCMHTADTPHWYIFPHT